MIVASFETEKDQKEILDKAVKYFVDNIGLKMTKRNDCCAYFEGEDQLGYVKVTLSQKGKKSLKWMWKAENSNIMQRNL